MKAEEEIVLFIWNQDRSSDLWLTASLRHQPLGRQFTFTNQRHHSPPRQGFPRFMQYQQVSRDDRLFCFESLLLPLHYTQNTFTQRVSLSPCSFTIGLSNNLKSKAKKIRPGTTTDIILQLLFNTRQTTTTEAASPRLSPKQTKSNKRKLRKLNSYVLLSPSSFPSTSIINYN